MKYDEFAFFNQQLGAMLRDGIPLEGALQQLCASMQRGELRGQLEQLESSLKAGSPRALRVSCRIFTNKCCGLARKAPTCRACSCCWRIIISKWIPSGRGSRG